MAGMLTWSSDSHRGLGVDELHYFKVFADSIISEVSRVNWVSTENSKFDLLSSLSHELRSPLHGILASAELLNGTNINSAQKEMVKMIKVSGFTLLETTDHLLTYCKINNFSKAKTLTGKQSENEFSSLETDLNLGVLVEEVTNILHIGQSASGVVARTAGLPPSAAALNSPEPICEPERPSVVVRVDQSQHWNIRSLPGAWRRIIMNILGNSLKWTDRGFIEISLTMSKNQNEPEKPLAHISVIDTGRGIAPEFLRHNLFTPFAQEDPLVEGVGLGLCIVRQLVTSLDGHINVKSEVGLGTQVDVYIPVHCINDNGPDRSFAKVPENPEPLQACLVAFNGYPDIKETRTGMLTVEAKRKLSIQGMIADVFMSRAGWRISLAESIEKGQGDFAILESSTLQGVTAPASLASIASNNGFKFLIILNDKYAQFDERVTPNSICISPPFGPNKIKNAVDKVLRLRQSQADLGPSPPAIQSLSLDRPLSYSSEKSHVHVETVPAVKIEIDLPQPLERLPSPAVQKSLHVLVVDDNGINLKVCYYGSDEPYRVTKPTRLWPHSCVNLDTHTTQPPTG